MFYNGRNPAAGWVNCGGRILPTGVAQTSTLSSLTGVNMTKVQKMSIGVGDRDAPQADGSGRIYIDDIRVIKP